MNNNSLISIVVITSSHWRHCYVVNHLAKYFNILGVVSETKRPLQFGSTVEEDKVIKEYDKEWEQKERFYFGKETNFNVSGDKILRVPYGTINREDVLRWIIDLNPQYIVLFSSSIIKEPLLRIYENRIINLHLGLTPYYRGAACVFWPLAFEEPECVGATVHLVVKELDAGSILGQVRPNIEIGDTHRDISNKNIISGVELLVRCIKGYYKGKIIPKPQPQNIGKVFKHKDFNAQAILKMRGNFTNLMIEKYLACKSERDSKYPIIQY